MIKRDRNRCGVPLPGVLSVQWLFAAAFVGAWHLAPAARQAEVAAKITGRPVALDVQLRTQPAATVDPLYDEPEFVSDDELLAVLTKVVPRFSRQHLRPNLVEHALRTWGSEIAFGGDDAISGPQMTEFLTDHSKYIDSWGKDNTPLMQLTGEGVHVRWADGVSGSVHHDHTLAALTEAGLSLDAPVYTTVRPMQVRNVLEEALRDFRLDERETEWSALSFALWMAPQHASAWHNGQGRCITFDLLADRLMRNHRRDGVCLGTHRVYSLMLMLRLNTQAGDALLAAETVSDITEYLHDCRDLIAAAQDADGSWTANWTDGAAAAASADPKAPFSKRVIATGHHLEWLAIAPREFHPPREQMQKAARWLVRTTTEMPQAELDQNYTYFSHVAKALAMWRKTSPAEFWTRSAASQPAVSEGSPD
jgi:hypothetical protein